MVRGIMAMLEQSKGIEREPMESLIITPKPEQPLSYPGSWTKWLPS